MQSYCKRSPNCHSFPGVHQTPTGLCAPATVHSHWGALLSLPGAGQALQARPCQQSHQHVSDNPTHAAAEESEVWSAASGPVANLLGKCVQPFHASVAAAKWNSIFVRVPDILVRK